MAGVLKFKVDGQWVELVAGGMSTDEIWVGDTDPYLDDPNGPWELWVVAPPAAWVGPTAVISNVDPNWLYVNEGPYAVTVTGVNFVDGGFLRVDQVPVSGFVRVNDFRVTFNWPNEPVDSGHTYDVQWVNGLTYGNVFRWPVMVR
jgi:hypothetical protein